MLLQPVVREFFRVIVSAISISGNGNPIVGSARRHATPVVRSSFPSLRNLAGSVACWLSYYGYTPLTACRRCAHPTPLSRSAPRLFDFRLTRRDGLSDKARGVDVLDEHATPFPGRG